MKRNFVSLFAVLSLALMAVGCGQKAGNAAKTEKTTETAVAGEPASGIVYFNMDSLVSNYTMFKDLSADFKVKADKIDKELEQKGRSFETKVKSSQEKIEKGLVTRSEAEQMSQELGQEQQQVIAYRDKMLGEMQEEQTVMQNKIFDAIQTYLKKYNAEKNYALILNTNAMTNTVMIGDPSLDITQELIDGLNAEYVPAKKPAAKK